MVGVNVVVTVIRRGNTFASAAGLSVLKGFLLVVTVSNCSLIWLAKDDDRGLRRLARESGVTGGDSTEDGFIGVGGKAVKGFSVNSGMGGMTRVTFTAFGSFSK